MSDAPPFTAADMTGTPAGALLVQMRDEIVAHAGMNAPGALAIDVALQAWGQDPFAGLPEEAADRLRDEHLAQIDDAWGDLRTNAEDLAHGVDRCYATGSADSLPLARAVRIEDALGSAGCAEQALSCTNDRLALAAVMDAYAQALQGAA